VRGGGRDDQASAPNKRPKGRLVRVDRHDPKAVARARALIQLLYNVHENSPNAPRQAGPPSARTLVGIA